MRVHVRFPKTTWLVGVAISAASILGVLAACVGDEASATNPSNGVDGGPAQNEASTVATDSGVPQIAADAAPSLGCPLNCLPPAPNGWVGPSAVYDGPTADKPATCPALYSQKEIEARQGITAAVAACTCGAVTPVGASCFVSIAAWMTAGCPATEFGDSALVVAGAANTDACKDPGTTYKFIRGTSAVFDAGTCTYAPSVAVLPPPTSATTNIACGLPQVGACTDRADCTATPIPDQPYSRLCIHKDGDESCPSLDYTQRFVAFKSEQDGRSCSACAGVASGSCGNKVGFSTDTACTVNSTASPAGFGFGCTTVPNATSTRINLKTAGPTGVACTANGESIPDGGVTPAEPVTFCCNK